MEFKRGEFDFAQDYQKIFVNEQTYHQLMLPYRMALGVTKAILEGLNEEMRCTYAHSPIHYIQSRIKSPESIIEKLYRRGFAISRHGLWQLQDITGLRVICKYVNDIYYIRERLLLQRDIVLVRESDYIKNPKPNGYRSYHLIITVPVYNSDGKTLVPVEIQICTMGMDMWASLEHNLRYKSEYDANDKIGKRLFLCSKMLEEVDDEMQEIYQQLNDQWGTINQ